MDPGSVVLEKVEELILDAPIAVPTNLIKSTMVD